jgi:hypothetical protein
MSFAKNRERYATLGENSELIVCDTDWRDSPSSHKTHRRHFLAVLPSALLRP